MIPTLEFLAGEKDVSCRQQEQTVNIFQLAFSVSPSSLTIPVLCDRQTCRQTVQKAAGVLLSNCLFSASAIVTKALCERPSWILCAFYFMVITIVIILLFLLMFFLFPQYRWLFKCKKTPPIWWWWYKKKTTKKKQTWIFVLKMVGAATLSGHKQTHLCTTSVPVVCSLLHSHTKVGTGGDLAGGRRTDLPLPALCLLSQILLGERSFDLILGDSFSWKRNLYNHCKAFWEGWLCWMLNMQCCIYCRIFVCNNALSV